MTKTEELQRENDRLRKRLNDYQGLMLRSLENQLNPIAMIMPTTPLAKAYKEVKEWVLTAHKLPFGFYVTRKPLPKSVSLCPHFEEYEDCPDCRH